MRKLILALIIISILIGLSACRDRDKIAFDTGDNGEKSVGVTEPVDASDNQDASNTEVTNMPAEVSPSPTGKGFREERIRLSEEELQKLGILIKWVYQANWIYVEGDAEKLQLPEVIELLPTDEEKMKFVTNVAVFEHMIGAASADGMNYTFTAEEADALVDAAVAEQFDEHKANDYISDYTDGIYSYGLAGGDGAAWWPEIEIDKVTLIAENEVRVKGILKSEHDIYSTEYLYDFKAVAVKNQKSPFGGFTLKELNIP